jgi:transcriptional regulator with XRE-family HTH domain
MPLQDKLKALRRAAGLSQEALAVAAGLSGSLVRKIEQGESLDPRMSTLKALAKVLGVSLDELTADDEGEAPKRKRGK